MKTQVIFRGGQYNLKTDHAEIKKQIKGWEKQLNEIVDIYNAGKINPEIFAEMDCSQVIDILETMSHEMMAINM